MEAPATSPPTSSAKLACQLSSWYPLFKAHTIESTIIPLSQEFLHYLESDGVVVPDDAFGKHKNTEPDDIETTKWDETEEELSPTRFPELERTIAATIAEYELAFPKLNWRSPRDAVWMSVDGSLRCRTPGEVFLLLKSSELLSDDLHYAKEMNAPLVLILRRWTTIEEGSEYRCFVKNRKLRGISQRHSSIFFPHAPTQKCESQTLIEKFFSDIVVNKFPLDDYAFDVYIDRRRRVRLLDFAPFRGTDSLLFEWDELAADTKQTDELIRVIEKASHIVPSPVAHYRLPRDLVNVSTANAIDEFSRESRDNNSNEAAKQP